MIEAWKCISLSTLSNESWSRFQSPRNGIRYLRCSNGIDLFRIFSVLNFLESANLIEVKFPTCLKKKWMNNSLTFLAVSSNLSVYLSKEVRTEFFNALFAARSSSAETEVAIDFKEAIVLLRISFPLSAEPLTLKPKRPESVKWKFKASAASK